MLPKQLKYGSRVESAASKSSRVNIAPNNGTGPYSLGDTIIFNIPTRANLVMVPNESYLRFNLSTLKASAATAIRLDSCGAHGCIQRVRLFHGSNIIQDIDNYGLLSKMLMDLQAPTDACYGKLNILAGTRSDLVLNVPTAAAAATAGNNTPTAANVDAGILAALAPLSDAKVSALQINSGALIRRNTGGFTLGVGELTYAPTDGANANVFCLNLNCLLGTLCSQNYFPLFACTSSPLRLEITLVDAWVKALNTVTDIDIGVGSSPNVMTNVEYVANFIELGDSAMSVVAASLQGQPLQMVVPDYRNYQFSSTLTQNVATQVSMAIPAKFSSLKSIFVTVRDKGTGALTFFPYSSVTCGIIDYQFRIGASVFPPKPPNTLPEMFSEVVKAIGSMSDLNHQPSIEKTSYQLVSSAANSVAREAVGASNINSGSFYIGIDLENYVGANNNCYMGWNSNTDDIYAIMNFNSPATVTARFDAFANFDCALVFENGTCYCRY